MNTNEAYELWSRVARGERGPEVDAFVRSVAQTLCDEIFPTAAYPIASERPPAALKAIGYFGRLDEGKIIDAASAQYPDMTPDEIAAALPLIEPITRKTQKIAGQIRRTRKKS